MKLHKKTTKKIALLAASALSLCVSSSVFAADKLSAALNGDVQDMLGSTGTFWKIFILVDVILAAAAAVKTKNPLIFGGVFFIALIPGLLLKAFVF